MGQDRVISLHDLPESLYAGPKQSCPPDASKVFVEGDSLEAYEMVAISSALEKCAGNRKRASMMLGIGEATLYRKLKKYDL